jgi:hypothetical protein
MKKDTIIETPLTAHGLQQNSITVKEEGKDVKQHIGYFLMADHKVAHCYRNNETVEAVSYPETKSTKNGVGQVQTISTGRNFSVQTIRPRKCGSHCIAFQLFQTGKGKEVKDFVRLNCMKLEYELTYLVENNIPGGK